MTASQSRAVKSSLLICHLPFAICPSLMNQTLTCARTFTGSSTQLPRIKQRFSPGKPHRPFLWRASRCLEHLFKHLAYPAVASIMKLSQRSSCPSGSSLLHYVAAWRGVRLRQPFRTPPVVTGLLLCPQSRHELKLPSAGELSQCSFIKLLTEDLPRQVKTST